MTTVRIVPTVVRERIGVTAVGGDAEDVVADVANDNTYLEFDDEDYISFGYTDVTLPAGAVSKSAELVFRSRSTSAFESVFEEFQLTYPPPDLSGSRRIVSTDLRPGVAYQNDSLETPLVGFSQARINRIRTNVWGFGLYLRIARIYIDVTYVAQPVVTLDAITPDPSGSATVPISWANTLDSDGGSARRYQVRAFTAAQVGGGGFSPTTTDPYVALDALSSDIDAEVVLPNDDWHIYVRVAQRVNGSYHWSEWDSDTVTVARSDAEVSSVTVSPDNASGSIEVTVNRDTGEHAWEWVEVQRSIDAGVTWQAVRFATYVDATGDADTFVVDDYEVGNGVSVVYRARAAWDDTDGAVIGNWSPTSASTSWTSTSVWLKDPTDPTKNVAVCLREAPSAGWTNRRGVFSVIGRSSPIVVSDGFSASSSESIVCYAESLSETADLLALLRTTNVLLVHPRADMPDADRYVSAGSVARVPAELSSPGPDHWIAIQEVVETDAPDDPTAGA